jgi:hypothetical protein
MVRIVGFRLGTQRYVAQRCAKGMLSINGAPGKVWPDDVQARAIAALDADGVDRERAALGVAGRSVVPQMA